jgi:ABC-type multidrug transport system fused ATPase/permease subunit
MGKVFRAVGLLSVLWWTVCVKAEEKPTYTRPENVITRMVHLQHADPLNVYQLLSGTGAQARFDEVLRVIVISGTPGDVASLEQTIHELDAEMAKTPNSNNVELTAYVLEGLPEGSADNPTPPALQSTIAQLKAAFPYQSYQSLETIVVRGNIGDNLRSVGALHPFQELKDNHVGPPHYNLEFRLTGISSSNGKLMVHINHLRFSTDFAVPLQNSYQTQNAVLDTNLDISAGQKVVVGKTGTGRSSLFLVVECKVVQ